MYLLSPGKRHNQGVLYFKPEGYETTEKQLYRGSFKNDMYHGHGTLYWPGSSTIVVRGNALYFMCIICLLHNLMHLLSHICPSCEYLSKVTHKTCKKQYSFCSNLTIYCSSDLFKHFHRTCRTREHSVHRSVQSGLEARTRNRIRRIWTQGLSR